MQVLTDIAPYVAVGAAALAVVLLVLVIVLWVGLRKLRRAQLVVMGSHDQRDIVAEVVGLDSQVRNLREAVEILTDQLDEHKAELDRALTNRAIVRYDAFRDAGGEQSASFALLDSYRSGVVFSAIAARDFARIYVKHLDHGVSDRELSPEEVEAVAAAVPRPLGRGEQGARALRAPRHAAPRPPLSAGDEPQTLAAPGQDELPLEPAGAGRGGPRPAGSSIAGSHGGPRRRPPRVRRPRRPGRRRRVHVGEPRAVAPAAGRPARRRSGLRRRAPRRPADPLGGVTRLPRRRRCPTRPRPSRRRSDSLRGTSRPTA